MILRNNNKKHICDHHVDCIWNYEDNGDDDDEYGHHHVHFIWNDEDDDDEDDDDVDDVVDHDNHDDVDDDDGWFLSLETLPHSQCMCLF